GLAATRRRCDLGAHQSRLRATAGERSDRGGAQDGGRKSGSLATHQARTQGAGTMTAQPLRAETIVPEFDESFRASLHDLFKWRRDVRRFRRAPLPSGALHRLLGIASLAP